MFTSRGSRSALLSLLCTAAVLAIAAPGASAASQRYASPAGLGSACSSNFPCNVEDAVEGAADGDEVILKPGDYNVAALIDAKTAVTIHGVAGKPRPRLFFKGGALLLETGSTLRYAEVDQGYASGTALTAWFSSLDQVVVRGGTDSDCAAIIDATMRNSVVIARSQTGSAICTAAFDGSNTSTYRNVTAIAHTGAAIEGEATSASANLHVNVVNTIARTDPGGTGLEIYADVPGSHATLTVTNSNYANYFRSGVDAVYSDGGGNQGGAPTFVNAAAGDYRQKPNSITVNAGHYTVVNGLLDVDGDPRNVGSPDIGADEYVPAPTATTGGADAVAGASATLTGIVGPRGAATTYHFEYGPTAAYGSSTASADAGSGLNAVAAAATLGALKPGATYHYRLVASSAGGSAAGADRTFTTAVTGGGSSGSGGTGSAGGSGSTGGSGSSGGAFAGVSLVSPKLTLAGRFVTVRLSCPAATAGRCTGRTKLTARRRRAGSHTAASVILGRARFSIAPGGRAKVRIRVSRRGRLLFARSRRLRGRAANAAHSGTGESKTTTTAVTIRKRHPRRG